MATVVASSWGSVAGCCFTAPLAGSISISCSTGSPLHSSSHCSQYMSLWLWWWRLPSSGQLLGGSSSGSPTARDLWACGCGGEGNTAPLADGSTCCRRRRRWRSMLRLHWHSRWWRRRSQQLRTFIVAHRCHSRNPCSGVSHSAVAGGLCGPGEPLALSSRLQLLVILGIQPWTATFYYSGFCIKDNEKFNPVYKCSFYVWSLLELRSCFNVNTSFWLFTLWSGSASGQCLLLCTDTVNEEDGPSAWQPWHWVSPGPIPPPEQESPYIPVTKIAIKATSMERQYL